MLILTDEYKLSLNILQHNIVSYLLTLRPSARYNCLICFEFCLNDEKNIYVQDTYIFHSMFVAHVCHIDQMTKSIQCEPRKVPLTMLQWDPNGMQVNTCIISRNGIDGLHRNSCPLAFMLL